MIPGSASPLLMSGDSENPYQIKRSLRFRGAQYLARTPGVAGNRKTWTWSGWVKRGFLGSGVEGLFEGFASTSNTTAIRMASDAISVQDVGGSYNLSWTTSAVFRDPSADYHIVVNYDSSQAIGNGAVKIYVNNVQYSAPITVTSGSYVQNRDSFINATLVHRFGTYNGLSSYLNGYLSEVNFIDGQALTPASFGMTDPVTGQWSPIAYAGTYGTNGFYLDFSDPSSTANLCLDRSGNANNWTPTGISITAGATYDSMLDVPTRYSDGGNGRGNYATLNPLSTTASTLTNGNLTASGTTDLPTILPASGNWYFEISGVTKNWTPPAALPSAAGDYNFGQRPFTNAITPGYQLLHTGQFTNESVTTSGSFTGNALANGPFVWMNGAPETLTINGNAVTFGTHADKLANGFKLRTTSASYNAAGTNTWTAMVLSPASKSAFRKQLAKANP